SSTGGFGRQRTTKLLQIVDSLARRLDQPQTTAWVSLARGIADFTIGKWKLGLTSCDRADEIFRERCIGVTWELDTAHTFALWSLVYMGEVAELGRRRP